MTAAPVDRHLRHRGRSVDVHVNVCRRRDRALSPETAPLEYHEIVFPLAGAWIRHVGRREVVVDAGSVHLFSRGSVHRVSHPGTCGDRNIGLVLSDESLAEFAPRFAELGFPTHEVRIADRVYAELLLLSRALREDSPDTLHVDESATGVVAAVLESLAVADDRNRASPQRQTRSQRDVAEAARAWLAQHYAESITLGDLAARLGVSAPHLCRVFRGRFGSTLHEHRHALRVRAALRHLRGSRTSLDVVAGEVGLGGRAQLSRALRASVGVSPGEWRARFDQGSSRRARGSP